MEFVPKKVLFETDVLTLERGQRALQKVKTLGLPYEILPKGKRVVIPGASREGFINAKGTLLLGMKRSFKFVGCKPSADFQLPISSSCPGMCEYCYLHTTLGAKPYVKAYLNIEEILSLAKQEMDKREDDVTSFEGSATSDPLPLEPFTGALKSCIEFFGQQKNGRFRFVTKFTSVDSLLGLKHNSHTQFRFSVNADYVISKFEHRTPPLLARLKAVQKVASAQYPLGLIIGPIMIFDGWEEQYRLLLSHIRDNLGTSHPVQFELITHRYTKRAKENIAHVFPGSELDMDEASRQFKYGQFGYGKYIYPKAEMADLKAFFAAEIEKILPQSSIDYFV